MVSNNIVYNLPYMKFKVCSIFSLFRCFNGQNVNLHQQKCPVYDYTTLLKKSQTTTLFLKYHFLGGKKYSSSLKKDIYFFL